ncbi:MAG TPA: hypothetical protein VFN45_01255 [Myxococcaceae bacterium]|nr:hypothetical protein [Myxococcaceae bacterium]
MTRSRRSSALLAASLLGVATGMRSLLPLAVLSTTRGRRPRLRALLLPLAATELVGDKLPQTPSRLGPVPLTFRLFAGGLGAAWLVPARRSVPLVLAGAAGALAGAVLGARARSRIPAATGTPDLPWAVLEDLTAATLTGAAMQLAPV